MANDSQMRCKHLLLNVSYFIELCQKYKIGVIVSFNE